MPSVSRRYPPGYGAIAPLADYRPWDVDRQFLKVYERIAQSTMVDVMRCWSLWHLLGQCGNLIGDILEVGVWRGGTGALLRARADSLKPLASRHVFLADTFYGVVKAGERDDYYRGSEHADATAQAVRKTMKHVAIGDYTILEGIFPDETGEQIADRRFCFCHIDVDVYRSAQDVLTWVWPRLAVGGIVVYDDYGFWGCRGVTAVGNEDYLCDDRLLIYNLNGQGILVKVKA